MVETETAQRERIVLPAVDVETLFTSARCPVVDLRSPGEFAVDHIPGAHNLPLFDDVARALIGTLYRQSSPAAAFAEGERHVRAHVAELVAAIAALGGWTRAPRDLEHEVEALCARGLDGLAAALVEAPQRELPTGSVLFHCWRGGLRSRSVVALLQRLGFDRALVLAGGYKAYRQRIVRALAGWQAPRAFVLRGWTGVGKTLVLREIEALRPGWTIDLEALAGHRSSLLGMIGLEPCSQKAFESRLAARVRGLDAQRIDGEAPIVFEGESRKVGDVILPANVWSALDGGTNLALVASAERRIEVLKREYLESRNAREELLRRLPAIEARMPGLALCALLERGAIDELVGVLLERYYDPLYRHGERGRRIAATFDASDPGRTARAIIEWIERALTAPVDAARVVG